MRKFKGLHDYVIDQGIIKTHEIVEPSMVEEFHLMSVHTERYVNAIWNGDLERKEARRVGLPWSKGLAVRSRLAVQGTINAALMALQDGIAGNLAGGTHHAMPNHGEGFCVFNDVAVAIQVLRQSKWVQRVMVIDCDVHQGNGTAAFFQDEPDVYTFSVHGAKNYPFRKPASTLDIGLPDKTGDKQYLQVLGDALDRIFADFQPDLVFYLGGIDPLEEDHFGRLSLSMNGLMARDQLVIESVTNKDIPLTLLLSGGYAPTLLETVKAHGLMYEIGKRYEP